jgi:hypothetical protein
MFRPFLRSYKPREIERSGLHLGRMQVANDAERVTRSVVLPVCAYLVLLHLYSGQDGVKDAPSQDPSLRIVDIRPRNAYKVNYLYRADRVSMYARMFYTRRGLLR